MPASRLTSALLAAWIGLAGCGPAPGRAAAASDGRLIAFGGENPQGACFACHGLDGAGDGAATPRIAGLGAGYLQKQMRDYASGLRPDPVMTPIAQALSERDRHSVARYYAGLPPVPAPTAAAPGERLGERLYLNGAPERGLLPCAACHGPAALGRGPGFPPLAGQPAAYAAEQLRRWKHGERRNDPRGVMVDQARRLSEAEIVALAAFLAQLHVSGGQDDA